MVVGFTVDINDLKEYLKLNNVETSLTDDELNSFCMYKINELEMELGVTITPKNHTEFIPRLDYDDKFLLDYYPVLSVNEVLIDGEKLESEDYILSSDDGIIYLKHNYYGNIRVDYTSGFNQTEFNNYIKTLIYDMLIYSQDNNSLNNVTSMSEGDTSINYDTSSLLSTRINNKINHLRNSFNVRAIML